MGLLLEAVACYFVILISVIIVKITDITSYWCHIVDYTTVLGGFLIKFSNNAHMLLIIYTSL